MISRRARLNPRTLSRLGAVVALVAFVLAAGCQKPTRDWFGSEVQDPQPAPPLVGTNWDGEPFAIMNTWTWLRAATIEAIVSSSHAREKK